jgi:exodeoxyribonuclease-3
VRIASWNVNSVRSRLEQLTAWLARSSPDVLCMQETKVEDELFPHAAFAELGYHVVATGQKTYNGVAIAVKRGVAVEDVILELPGNAADEQRRLIAATVAGVRIIDVYVPNGQAIGAEAYAYKLAWLDRLRTYLEAEVVRSPELLVCGDFNIAPEPVDVWDPPRWEGNVLFSPVERAALKRLLGVGLVDVYRRLHEGETGLYSWWDYRMSGFRKNRGLRIDLGLATPSLAARCREATIDKRPRELDKPSDHAPLVLDFE